MGGNVCGIDVTATIHMFNYLFYYLTGDIYVKDQISQACCVFGKSTKEGLLVEKEIISDYFSIDKNRQFRFTSEAYGYPEIPSWDKKNKFILYRNEKEIRKYADEINAGITERLSKLPNREETAETLKKFCIAFSEDFIPVTEVEIVNRFGAVFYSGKRLLSVSWINFDRIIFLYFINLFGSVSVPKITQMFPNKSLETLYHFARNLARDGLLETKEASESAGEYETTEKGRQVLSGIIQTWDETINKASKKKYKKVKTMISVSQEVYDLAASIFKKERF